MSDIYRARIDSLAKWNEVAQVGRRVALNGGDSEEAKEQASVLARKATARLLRLSEAEHEKDRPLHNKRWFLGVKGILEL